MIIEKNGIDIPDYLNTEFFQKVIKNGLKKGDVKIDHLDFAMGCDGGDNYCSFIYRVAVNFTTSKYDQQRIVLIVKSIPTDSHRVIFQEIKVYDKEARMYFKILPKIEDLLKIRISARCYHAEENPIQTIVFEDLKQSGYRLADREKGLNEQHCAILLKKLGQFHAVSMSLAEEDPDICKDFSSGLFNKNSLKMPLFESVFQKNFISMMNVVEQWPEYEEIVKKLKIIEKDFLKKAGVMTEPSTIELKVLNHGDLWVNNFMFKYNKDSSMDPTDIIFIDFQGSYYTSPGIDINYFLNTSVEQEVLENRREYMLREYYYKSLKETLEDLEFRNIPTFDDIMIEVRRKEYYGFFAAVCLLPLVCMDKDSSKDNSIETYSSEETAKKKAMQACESKRFQDLMRYSLKRGDLLGLFD